MGEQYASNLRAGRSSAVAVARTAAQRRQPERRLVRFVIGADTTVLCATASGALLVGGVSAPFWQAAVWAVVTVPVTLLVFAFHQLYERDRRQIAVSSLDELRDFLSSLTLVGFGQLALFALLTLAGAPPIPAWTVLAFWAASLVVLPAVRTWLRHVVVPALDTPQNTVIIGAGMVGQDIARKIRKHPEYNLRIVGFLDDDPKPLGAGLDDLPVLGSEDDLVAVLRRHRVSRVVLAFSRRPASHLIDLIRRAGLRDVHLSMVPRYFEIMPSSIRVADVEGIPVLEMPSARLSRTAAATKRSLDLAVTVPVLVLLAPVFALVALAIRLDSPGPVLFRQLRMGRGDRAFRILKFRTMVEDAELHRDRLLAANESSGPLFKIRSDPRVTRVGRVLRAACLDELPQLLNVVRGEMSLVGPRPFVVSEDEKIEGWARRRLELSPGITGLWQVLGRNDIPFDEMVRLDYLYVTNWSLWWDVKLVLRTVPIVLGRRGY